MRKKGIGWGTFISLFFGVIVVSVIIFAIAFPGQLGSKTRDVSFSFGLGELPADRPPEFGGTPYTSKELKDYFNGLVAKIETFETEEHCLIPLDQIPNLGRFIIHLTAVDGADSGKISLLKEGQGGFVVTESKEFNDFDFYPCIVTWGGAENFYNNWLDGSIAIPPITHEYYNNIDAMTINLESGTEIRTPNEGDAPGRKYDISDYDNRRYLYKADASHFCFISIHGGGSCSLKPSHRSIEEGCLDGMPFFVGTCDGSSVPQNRFYSTCDNICNKIDGQKCIMGIDDGNGDNNIKKCDESFRFEGHDDYCICSDDSEKRRPYFFPGDSDRDGVCNVYCDSTPGTSDKCIMGIDDGKKPRRCDKIFTFENDAHVGDDYCFCRGDSSNFFPVLAGGDEHHRCMDADMCGSRSNCIIGMDDEDDGDGDRRRCNEKFRFESGDSPRDDYCICGETSTSEKVVPIPT